ncbi:5644_t:CDS:2, partial [Acaulospora colombiana]
MSEKRETGVDFSIEERGQLSPTSNNVFDQITEEKYDQSNVVTTNVPQLTLERTLSIRYRTLSIQTSDSIQAAKHKVPQKGKKA